LRFYDVLPISASSTVTAWLPRELGHAYIILT